MTVVYRSILTGLIAVIITLAGCGGGGGGTTLSGIGGTGKTISGTITGFGSIIVNGVHYEVTNADFSINDTTCNTQCQSNLRTGMVVIMTGDDDGKTGIASVVVYDNEITGPVTGPVVETLIPGSNPPRNKKTFTVFGTTVEVAEDLDINDFVVDESTIEGINYADLDVGVVIEASGLFKGDILVASYVRKTDDLNTGGSEVELKGNPDQIAGPTETFTMNGITIIIDADANLDEFPNNRVEPSQFIEVKGTVTTGNPGVINATRIELENEGIGSSEGEASIEGFVTEFNDNSDFKVSGQPVDATGATFEPAGLVLSNDLHVEIEGELVNGVLIATEVKLED